MKPAMRGDGGRSRLLSRLPFHLVSPPALLAMALAMHVIGRIAGFCGPFKVDSLVYAASAYRIYQPDATYRDLVPDKPPGQMLLTGWCFRLWPDAPSRITLVPIESAFLLAAYVTFWILTSRLCGRALAGALTLMMVVAFNHYNALDSTTDGFNLNENYVAFPMWLAVLAHLTMRPPVRRGIVRGLGLGLAMSMKQTTLGLAAAMLIHGLLRLRRAPERRHALLAGIWSLGVIGLLGALVLGFLAARGWFADYVPGLADRASRRVGGVGWRLPEDYKLVPLAPFAWWAGLGLLALLWRGRRDAEPAPSPAAEAALLPAGPSATPRGAAAGQHQGLVVFAALWLIAEALFLWHLRIPATHYYQQLVAPAALLGGAGLSVLAARLRRVRMHERIEALAWISATTVAFVMLAAMPLMAAAAKLAPTFNRTEEIRLFRGFCELARASQDFNWKRENWP